MSRSAPIPITRRVCVGLLCFVPLVAACEKVSRQRAPLGVDAAAVPAPDAMRPSPDGAPGLADARPAVPDGRPPTRPQRLDACDSDADCTTYGDPCGRGIFPVSRLHEERVRAAAQKDCPGESINYLTTQDGSATRCLRKRCRMANEIGVGDR
jgi:hypothetical protein